ncbi:TetR/AcrR family transcriptional regulator, partial [Nocardia cyriacigeorgica]|uniref:TetR/AcrR family transcriptional regulator n=1 Tax=Nocardia cyriacigeorgica TaxID=135487 RepID=UPI0024560B64
MTGTETGTLTRREQQKAERRRQLLDAGARLIADRGFLGMRLDDLGAAVGISGPAVYRHFPNKEALLVELLVGVSRRLFEGGEAVVADAASGRPAPRGGGRGGRPLGGFFTPPPPGGAPPPPPPLLGQSGMQFALHAHPDLDVAALEPAHFAARGFGDVVEVAVLDADQLG